MATQDDIRWVAEEAYWLYHEYRNIQDCIDAFLIASNLDWPVRDKLKVYDLVEAKLKGED